MNPESPPFTAVDEPRGIWEVIENLQAREDAGDRTREIIQRVAKEGKDIVVVSPIG